MNDTEILEFLQKSSLIIKDLQEKTKLQSMRIDELTDEIVEVKEENKTWELVSNSDNLFEMSEVAKVLNYKGYGRNKIFELLRDMEILRNNNQPYQKYVDTGYFKQIEQVIQKEFRTIINLKTVVSQKGLDFIRRKLDEYTNK